MALSGFVVRPLSQSRCLLHNYDAERLSLDSVSSPCVGADQRNTVTTSRVRSVTDLQVHKMPWDDLAFHFDPIALVFGRCKLKHDLAPGGRRE